MDKNHDTSNLETIEEYIDRGGIINIIQPYNPGSKDFPANPKGKHIVGQEDGCLMIPRYQGQ